ncbi:uncharacterized protein METZ01_LOCUS295947, partial [marine metagenome]
MKRNPLARISWAAVFLIPALLHGQV